MSTDASGKLHLSAFAGDYEISLNGQQQTFDFDKNKTNPVVTLKLN
jgi:hypothetical protein